MLLGLGPLLASISLTGRAVSVTTRVIGVLGLLAVVAEIDVSTECRGPALLDVAHDAQVRGEHAIAKPIAIRPSHLAEDVRDAGHGVVRTGSGLEPVHQAFDGIAGDLPHLGGEVGIERGGLGAAVSEVALDDAQVDAIFE